MTKRNVEILAGGGRYLLVAASTGIISSGFEMGHGSKKGADVSYEIPNGMIVISNPEIGIPRGRKALTLNLSDDDRKKIEDSIDSSKAKSSAKAKKIIDDIDKVNEDETSENASLISDFISSKEAQKDEDAV